MVETYPSYVPDLESVRPPLLTVSGLRKAFGTRHSQVTALDGLDLAVAEGEILTLLGPAGSGKSALLAVLAGAERADSGRLHLAGAELPKGGHAIGRVVTDFAPKTTVRDVLAGALKIRGVARRDLEHELGAVLDRVVHRGDPDTRVLELPTHTQLLVAIAAEAVAGARVVLLDDPLAAIDAVQRDRMHDEIRAARDEFGLTLIVATRTPQLAMGLGERVAVMLDGKVVQIGAPPEVYELPATEQVAALTGPVNLLRPEASVQLMAQPASFGLRPEKIRIVGDDHLVAADEVLAAGTVVRIDYGGATSRLVVRLDAAGATVQVLRLNSAVEEEFPVIAGQRVTVVWPRRHAVRFF
ncbi:ABC transporter ATP-binding protein [Kineosporia sp. J2-2]|uniref:ABC transporter ATP-binding protein n=1 Tax=Kineosporia corallincola TaxID=2835133 RepID=A0ABS5TNL7_9ACTN|nr:ATP-binding cassette domain-containing protein [Kineosporia corallincola]MBT0772699.1 ABC transporter ATP-binding protein [Kineosporia corallincola]